MHRVHPDRATGRDRHHRPFDGDSYAPALQRVRKQAQAVACQSNLKQMGLTFSMYTGDNNGYFHQEEGSEASHSWVPAMRPYYSREPKIRVCPATTKFYSDGVTGPLVGWGVYGQGISPPCRTGPWRAITAVSASTAGSPTTRAASIRTRTGGRFKFRAAYQVPVFVDCQWVDGLPEPYDSPPDFDGQCEWQWYGDAMRSFCLNRHNGSVNGVFIDLSTRPMGLKELWEVHWHRQWAKNRAATRPRFGRIG